MMEETMKKGSASLVTALVLFALVGFGINVAHSLDCTTIAFQGLGLTDIDGREVTIDNAEIVAAAAPLPEHCFVRGLIAPEHYFEVRLPTTTWNGKFYQVGGGGWDGSVNTQWQLGLEMNFATAAGSGGHLSPTTNPVYAPGLHGFVFPLKEPYYTTFYNDPGLPAGSPAPPNDFAGEMTVDFGYRSHGATAVLAKSMINEYYSADPSYSYYVGCSNGGREALVVAQKYPTLFNGIVAGAPVISFVGTNMRGIWDNQYGTGAGGQGSPVINLTQKGIALYQAVYGKCDSVDGLVDGFIDDPQRCPFDALTDFPACPGDVDADNCFTTAQRQALKNIYDGPYDAYRNPLYPGQPLSAEYLTPGTCFPQPCTPPPFSSGFSAAVWDFYATNAGQWLFFYEPGGPTWSYMDFDWDVDPKRIRNNYIEDLDGLPKQLSDIVDAATFDAINAPNMGGLYDFYNNGGKLIHYHGWSDALVSPAPSVNFYEAVVRGMDQTTVDSFYKLYMVPGMGHCGGGIGCGAAISNLMVDTIINWVESDETPQALTGTRAENADPTYGWTARTRPICPYPEVARYKGTGSIDEATNFTCATIVPATVDIKQVQVKVGKGAFAAKMAVPEGYNFTSKKEIGSVVSEGALAKRIALNKNKGIISANFKMKDVVGMTPGDAVIFTVTALFDQEGKTFALEGSDTVKVLEK
jgi:feruloyl esterase